MRNLVFILLFLYSVPTMAIDNVLLNSVLLTSDKKDYDDPKLSIADFKNLIDELASCDSDTKSEIIEVSQSILKIRYKNKKSIFGETALSEFTIAYLKHKDGYYAYLQTHDRGTAHIWDEERFIPSSEMVAMIRIMARNCE